MMHCTKKRTWLRIVPIFFATAFLLPFNTQFAEMFNNSLLAKEPKHTPTYEIGVSKGKSLSRYIQGQVLEANAETGQIVYLVRSRRNYLTIDPQIAGQYADKLSRLETVEIKGFFRYDRTQRFYIAD